MAIKDNIRTTAEILLILAFVASLGVNINNQDSDEGYIPYSCSQDNVEDMMCYKLSRVSEIDGVQRYCYYNRDKPRSYKRCNEGWERIINVDEYEQKQECEPLILAYTDEGKYVCSGIGKDQECIRTEDILSELG